MGWELSQLPDKVLGMIDKKDRPGKAGATREEALEIGSLKLERHMHQEFASWMDLNEIFYYHGRTDKKSCIRIGLPDFVCFKGSKFCVVEMKLPGGNLRPEQAKVIASMVQQGVPVLIAYSTQDAIEYCRRMLL